LPKLTNSHLLNYCKIPVSSNRTKIFQHKLFKYIYCPAVRGFIALNFSISTTYDVIGRKFHVGLNESESKFQKKLYGECDLDVQIPTVSKLLLTEIKDPFYFFQLFSVILWMYNNYEKYAIVIILTTSISLFIGVYETRKNLLNIQRMAKYSCEVSIHKVKVIIISN
jgi:cation-transporting ATPase 13A2